MVMDPTDTIEVSELDDLYQPPTLATAEIEETFTTEDFSSLASDPGSDNDWITSFSDIVTLLLCFFILLIDVSKPDEKKREEAQKALQETLNVDKDYKGGLQQFTPFSAAKENKKTVTPANAYQEIATTLQETLVQFNLEKETLVTNRKTFIDIVIFNAFPSGSDQLRAKFLPTVAIMAQLIALHLNKDKLDISIIGHTDPQKIHSRRFKSNWELGSARAINLLNLLTKQGLKQELFRIISLGDTIAIDQTDWNLKPTAGLSQETINGWHRRIALRVAQKTDE